MPRALIVGSGFLGRALADTLAADGWGVALASRNSPRHWGRSRGQTWLPLDAVDREACLRTVEGFAPDRTVLVHGPSDVTWCERHPVRAWKLHGAITANIALAAPGTRPLLISTDSVFDGTDQHPTEATPVHPVSGYGRAKVNAERVLHTTARDGSVLRVSLVYGYEFPNTDKWLNFFSACAHRLVRGRTFLAPTDQWTTPVHVDDVARVAGALLEPGAPAPPPLLHLGGPERVSRAAWAGTIADAVGAPRSLLRAVPRAESRYASRPENTCLSSTFLRDVPALRDRPPRRVREVAWDLAPMFQAESHL
ncbi:NAD(P)-dependent oxidoreductase [Nocardiopsis kunsanensis]|uniref:NAD(P)-dependent oxidoreductase n=2 Tax=Nocardiopsis kunsanensis TaxID=141693 RepID=A0A918XBG8_9ACTN|nr:NAD(P)-dependent oxidoreductase [Nocardiopsis kunsanensis]